MYPLDVTDRVTWVTVQYTVSYFLVFSGGTSRKTSVLVPA